jgi:signal transduction histidine kinase
LRSRATTAVCFCRLEALQNAAKHAAAASVDVRLWESSGEPLFRVAWQRHGCMNMADRLGAIGGCWRTSAYPSGA